ncbi:hypothetical protein RSAG8_11280, partial [Rhizoctonia solani AG-8 WAC10335]
MRAILLGALAFVLSLLLTYTKALGVLKPSPAVVELPVVPNELKTSPRNTEPVSQSQRFGLRSSFASELSRLGHIVRKSCPAAFGICPNTGGCCPLGGGCCSNGACCTTEYWCYGGGCCSRDQVGCDEKGCCPIGWNCCIGGSCCPPGQSCFRSTDGKIRCCPNGEACAGNPQAKTSTMEALVPPFSA